MCRNCIIILMLFISYFFSATSQTSKQLRISGVYPHLAVYNPGGGLPCNADGNECGIGAIVPWIDKLYLITYSSSCPKGSSDKLWMIDTNLKLEMHPASIGGTPANRLIHKETEQLIIGPYFIDKKGNVRVVPYTDMPGRHTATTRHLTDPENMVYFQAMEGNMFEINVHTLKPNKLFEKPVTGWHAKGAYIGQGRYVFSNNGESKVFDVPEEYIKAGKESQHPDEIGCLAEWDGETWRIVDRRQYTEVTGPGGIYGNEKNADPIWSVGWDRRSLLLKILDNGKWYTYRLPKATNTYDHRGGSYNEWPRIREVFDGKLLMDMHGMLFDFPKTFSSSYTNGLSPISTHLRIIPDFCGWNDQIVIASDETTTFNNPFVGRSWSNLWFGKLEDLKTWGPVKGYGGPWSDDLVLAGQQSDPFLINGFEQKILHLAHDNFAAVTFTIEIDEEGKGRWAKFTDITIPPKGYEYFIFPDKFNAVWVRIVSDTECRATAMFHFGVNNYISVNSDKLFDGIADLKDQNTIGGMIRPAGHNLSLQLVVNRKGKDFYYELDEKLNYTNPDSRIEEVKKICEYRKDFSIDDASVIMELNGVRVRLPKGNDIFNQPFTEGWPRGIREAETERYLMNIHGTFYEMPREAGLNSLRPVASHNKKIMDFCTWRGLLVISGVDMKAKNDGHVFFSDDKKAGLWFGAIDDLWNLGKPVGVGGPWKNTKVAANIPSDKYLMTGYDKKTLELLTDEGSNITAEIDIDFNGWHKFKIFELKAGEKLIYQFPQGFNAHWIRFISDKNCLATACLKYE